MPRLSEAACFFFLVLLTDNGVGKDETDMDVDEDEDEDEDDDDAHNYWSNLI